jgi:hypothetical protein
MTEIITHISDADREVYAVRYQKAAWLFVFHNDPGLDLAVNPQGKVCNGMWSPTGYRHPDIPAELLEELDGLLNSIS